MEQNKQDLEQIKIKIDRTWNKISKQNNDMEQKTKLIGLGSKRNKNRYDLEQKTKPN